MMPFSMMKKVASNSYPIAMGVGKYYIGPVSQSLTCKYCQASGRVKKVKVLDIAPLNKRSTYQQCFDNRGSGA